MHKILLVEDELDQRSILSDFLSPYFEVIEAEDGKQGLELALVHSPHIILLDIVMPVMDGFEMMKALRDHNLGNNIPIMILSNMDLDDIQLKIIAEKPPAYYLLKTDVSIAEVKTKIEEIIHVEVYK